MTNRILTSNETGFSMKFQNGVTVSVQWGAENECSNKNKNEPTACNNAEVLIWSQNGSDLTDRCVNKIGEDLSYTSPSTITKALAWAKSLTDHIDVVVTKFKNGRISLRLLNAAKISQINTSILCNTDMFMEDLYFRLGEDGWTYIIDASTNLVYSVDDCGYNILSDMMTGKSIKLYPMNSTDADEILSEW